MKCDTYIAFLSRKNKLEKMNLQMLQQIQALRVAATQTVKPHAEA